MCLPQRLGRDSAKFSFSFFVLRCKHKQDTICIAQMQPSCALFALGVIDFLQLTTIYCNPDSTIRDVAKAVLEIIARTTLRQDL